MPIEPTSVVMVRARQADGSYTSGSGYLLNERTVITAARLLAKDEQLLTQGEVLDIQVRRLGNKDWIPGQPAWMSTQADVTLTEACSISRAAGSGPHTLGNH